MKIVTSLALGTLVLGPALNWPAMGQGTATPGFVGSSASSVAGCPRVMWRLARDGDNVNGIAYYSDLSGLSHVTGTVDKAGAFTLTLTSAMGNGPVATVTGKRAAKNPALTEEAQGALEATMTGAGCANMRISIRPTYNLNTYGGGGGG
jgi:hypothetical protein